MYLKQPAPGPVWGRDPRLIGAYDSVPSTVGADGGVPSPVTGELVQDLAPAWQVEGKTDEKPGMTGLQGPRGASAGQRCPGSLRQGTLLSCVCSLSDRR